MAKFRFYQDKRVSFDERDDDQMFDLMEDQNPTNFEIYSCDNAYCE